METNPLYKTFKINFNTAKKNFKLNSYVIEARLLKWQIQLNRPIKEIQSVFVGNINLANDYLQDIKHDHNSKDINNPLQLHAVAIDISYNDAEEITNVEFECIFTKEITDFINSSNMTIEQFVNQSIISPLGLAKNDHDAYGFGLRLVKFNSIDMLVFYSEEEKIEYVKLNHHDLIQSTQI